MSNAVCNICNNSEKFKVLQDIPPYKVLECEQCALDFLHPQITQDSLDDHYEEDYYASSWNKDDTEIRYRVKEVQSFKKGGKLLDIGCGAGRFIKLAKEFDFNVEGTELSKFASKYVEDKLSVPCHQGQLEDMQLKDNDYDIVTLWHVIEHLPDPLKVLKQIHRTLKDKGLLFVATPNEDFWYMRKNPKRADRVREDLIKVEGHLYFFTAETLKKMMEKAGFKVIKKTIDFNKGVPKLEHHFKYYMFKTASIFGIHNYKAILLVGEK